MPEVKLTVKQIKFMKEYVKDGNGTRAAMAVYDTKDPRAASVIASENLSKLSHPMRLLMEQKGITSMSLIETVDEARKAEKWNDFTGEREADHHIRLKAVDRLSKWAGLEPKEDKQVTVPVQINNFINKEKELFSI